MPDILELRRTHRIMGALIGSLPNHGLQNTFPGAPLQLSMLEVALCVDKDIATLVSRSTVTDSRSELQDVCQYLTQLCQNFVDGNNDVRVKSIEAQTKAGLKHITAKRALSMPTAEAILEQAKLAIEENSQRSEPMLIQDWIEPIERLIDLSDFSHAPNLIVSLPVFENHDRDALSTPPELLEMIKSNKYFVYKSIHSYELKVASTRFLEASQQQLCQPYLTSGNKFGGDFCLYPGDPFRFHAAAVVKILPYAKQKYRYIDVVRWARLTNTTNKVTLVASRKSKAEVSYFTFEWTGW